MDEVLFESEDQDHSKNDEIGYEENNSEPASD